LAVTYEQTKKLQNANIIAFAAKSYLRDTDLIFKIRPSWPRFIL